MLPVGINDFKKIKMLSDPNFSPDGKYVFILVHQAGEKDGYMSNLNIYSLENDDFQPLTTKDNVKNAIWETDNTILFTISNDKTNKDSINKPELSSDVYRINIQTRNIEKAFNLNVDNIQLLARLSEDLIIFKSRVNLNLQKRLNGKKGDEKLLELQKFKEESQRFSIYDEYPFWFNGSGVTNKTRNSIFLYKLSTDDLTQISSPLMDVVGVDVSESYQKVVWYGCEFDKINDYRSGVYMYDHTTGQTDCFVKEGKYRIRHVAAYDSGVILAGTDMKEYNYSQTPEILFINSPNATPTPLYNQPLTIGSSVISDVRYGGGSFFRIEEENIYLITQREGDSGVVKIRPNGECFDVVEFNGSVDSFDIFGDFIVNVGMKDCEPQELFINKSGKKKKITSLNEDYLNSHRVTKPIPLSYINKEGIEIQGYVIPPSDYIPGKRKSYPGILNIHGGPRLSYGSVFHHEMQYEAGLGLFVFYCNPRGSDGRGNEFAYIRGRYGTIDYEDVIGFCDAVLNAYPEIDEERLAVSGGSYGGFMTNWIIGNTNRFAVAISQRGISNFLSMEGTSDSGRIFTQGHIGANIEENPQVIWNQSPLKYVDNVTTPTLFLHSEEDYRCWTPEAFQMYTAIRQKGIRTRMCLFKGENHELSRSGKPKNRKKRLSEITKFMNEFLKLY